eukprot:COSAG01_NODE_3800_length_5685_cov_4.802542_9_plen_146_part_00
MPCCALCDIAQPFTARGSPVITNCCAGPGIMGLHTILKKLKLKEREMKLLVVGLDNAGKTTIVKKFNGEDIETISPTLGFQINTMEYKGYKLNIWDVGGQKTIRACATLSVRPPGSRREGLKGGGRAAARRPADTGATTSRRPRA